MSPFRFLKGDEMTIEASEMEKLRGMGAPSFAINALANKPDDVEDLEEGDEMEIEAVEAVKPEVPKQQAKAAPAKAPDPEPEYDTRPKEAGDGRLTSTQFADFKTEALKRMSDTDRLRITAMLDENDEMMWQFLFLSVFGGNSETLQRMQRIDAKMDEFKGLVETAERQAGERIKEAKDLAEQLRKEATENEKKVKNFHTAAVAHVVKNTASAIGQDVSASVSAKANEAMEKALRTNMLTIVAMTLFGAVASGAIGFLAAAFMLR